VEVIVRNLRIAFPSHQGTVEAVRGVSFTLGQEKLGIVGESGSGKTLTARALLRLLPRQAKLEADRLEFDGIDLLKADERTLRRIRFSLQLRDQHDELVAARAGNEVVGPDRSAQVIGDSF